MAPGMIVGAHAQTPERILASKAIGADDFANLPTWRPGLRLARFDIETVFPVYLIRMPT